MAELQRIGTQSPGRGFKQHLVQVGAMDGKLRPVVAGVATARFLVDELAMPAEEGELARLDGAGYERVLQAKLAQLAHGMWQQVDADAERMDLRCRLEYTARDASLVQAERQREPADAAAHDQHIGIARAHS